MTSIQGHGRPCRERTSKGPSESSPTPDFSHNDGPVNPPAEPPVAKYTEENLQRIFKTILKARALPSDGPREKPLKARSPDIYYGKSHMECYNFCQQYKDHFAIAEAKDPNCIPFTISFLRNRINFHWQQYKRKYETESTVFMTWEEFKTFLCQSLREFRAFVDSY